jgi:hypothetical protein
VRRVPVGEEKAMRVVLIKEGNEGQRLLQFPVNGGSSGDRIWTIGHAGEGGRSRRAKRRREGGEKQAATGGVL